MRSVAARWDDATPRAARNVRPVVWLLIFAVSLAAYGLMALVAWELVR